MIYVEAMATRNFMDGTVFISEVSGAMKPFDRTNVNRSVNEIGLRVRVAAIAGSMNWELNRVRMAFGVQ